jgi:hypothetical protein
VSPPCTLATYCSTTCTLMPCCVPHVVTFLASLPCPPPPPLPPAPSAQVWEASPQAGDTPFLDALWAALDEVRQQQQRWQRQRLAAATRAAAAAAATATAAAQGRAGLFPSPVQNSWCFHCHCCDSTLVTSRGKMGTACTPQAAAHVCG